MVCGGYLAADEYESYHIERFYRGDPAIDMIPLGKTDEFLCLFESLLCNLIDRWFLFDNQSFL